MFERAFRLSIFVHEASKLVEPKPHLWKQPKSFIHFSDVGHSVIAYMLIVMPCITGMVYVINSLKDHFYIHNASKCKMQSK